MRFKKFLSEQEDPIKSMIDMFKSDYSDAYNLKTKLYRGLSDGLSKTYEIRNKDKFVEPRGERGTKPILIETIFEICPAWKKFPDRTKSMMFTINESEAEFFGRSRVVRVFPKNGSKIGVAPSDFNYFKDWPMIQKYKLEGITYDLADELLPQCYILCSDKFELSNMTATIYGNSRARQWFAKNYLTVFDYFNKNYVGKDVVKEYKNIIETKKFRQESELKSVFDVALGDFKYLTTLTEQFNGDLEKMFKTIFDPDNNEFAIITTSDIDKHPKKLKNELWTTDDCLIMSQQTFDVVERKMKNG